MDYAGLQTSLQNWSLRTDSASVAELPTIIGFAEDTLNHGMPERSIAPLRVREMLETATITMTDGSGALPDDYLQYFSVRSMASTPRPLEYATSSFTNYAYPDGASGLSNTFSITGVSTINVFPVSASDVELVYYQKIPALSSSNTSNWLLAKLPALYLHAGLLQLGLFNRDNELIQRSQAMVAAMIDGLNMTDMMGSYAKVGTRMRMLTP